MSDSPDGPGRGEPPSAPVALPVEDELDLHTFSPRDVPSVVEEYVRVCRERGLTPVRIIHGRGKGVQRAAVQRVLRGLPGVVEIREALPGAGGWGATIVHLASMQGARET